MHNEIPFSHKNGQNLVFVTIMMNVDIFNVKQNKLDTGMQEHMDSTRVALIEGHYQKPRRAAS